MVIFILLWVKVNFAKLYEATIGYSVENATNFIMIPKFIYTDFHLLYMEHFPV